MVLTRLVKFLIRILKIFLLGNGSGGIDLAPAEVNPTRDLNNSLSPNEKGD